MQTDKQSYSIKMAMWRTLSKKLSDLRFEHVSFVFDHVQQPKEFSRSTLRELSARMEKILTAWQKKGYALPQPKKTEPTLNHAVEPPVQNESRSNTIVPIPQTSQAISYRLVLDAFDRDTDLWPEPNPFQIALGNNLQSSMHNFTRMRGVVNETFTHIETISIRDIIFPKLIVDPDNPEATISALEYPYLLLFINEIKSSVISSDELMQDAFCLVQLEHTSAGESNYLRSMQRIENTKTFVPRTNLRALTFTFRFPDGRLVAFPETITQSIRDPIIGRSRGSVKGKYAQQLVIFIELTCACPSWSALPEPMIPA